ncbi:MAG: AsnC family transcriptional regulator [Haloglomus sp.]
MPREQSADIDEIDTVILKILASDPRAPYTDIAAELEEEGYEMSGEGIRYRVRKLMDVTTTFFFIDLEQVNGEIVRVAISTTDEQGAKDRAFQEVSQMQFWHVTRGIGTYDIYAVGLTSTIRDMDDLLTSVRELGSVETVDHVVATERNGDIESYLSGFQKQSVESGEDSDEPSATDGGSE